MKEDNPEGYDWGMDPLLGNYPKRGVYKGSILAVHDNRYGGLDGMPHSVGMDVDP